MPLGVKSTRRVSPTIIVVVTDAAHGRRQHGIPKETAIVINRDDTIEFLERLRERGQGMVEYGLIIALVAVAAIVGLNALGPAIKNMLTSVASSV